MVVDTFKSNFKKVQEKVTASVKENPKRAAVIGGGVVVAGGIVAAIVKRFNKKG